MITRRRFAVIAAASAFAPVLVGRAAFAQPWPTRFVRFVVPSRQVWLQTSVAACSPPGSRICGGNRPSSKTSRGRRQRRYRIGRAGRP